MAEVIVVGGGHWGDEGKGKVIDLLSENATAVERPSGGDNAGHSVKNHLGEFANHLMPSGILNPDVINIVGNNVAFNPETFLEECRKLRARGVNLDRLVVSERAPLTLEYHRWLDGAQEDKRQDDSIGTTKRGIGPTYMDKAERTSSLRAGDLKRPNLLMDLLSKVLADKRAVLFKRKEDTPDIFYPEYYEELVQEAYEVLEGHITNTDKIVNELLGKNSKIILEGAQGTLLDVTYGTHPNVTSSGTTVMSLMADAKIPPQFFTRSIGIFKIPMSRVGNGGMPTELKGTLGDTLRERGHEYGTTTGRPRRLGWFDGVASRYSQEINMYTDVALVKGDVLTGLDEVLVCNEYELDGKPTCDFPLNDRELQRCNPKYDSFKGWTQDFTGKTELCDLPEEFLDYINRGIMPNLPGARLVYIGTGPGRDEGVNLGI